MLMFSFNRSKNYLKFMLKVKNSSKTLASNLVLTLSTNFALLRSKTVDLSCKLAGATLAPRPSSERSFGMQDKLP